MSTLERDYMGLSEHHCLSPAANMNMRNLKTHLILHHGLSVKNLRTPKQMATTHLLAHSLQVLPELRQLVTPHYDEEVTQPST